MEQQNIVSIPRASKITGFPAFGLRGLVKRGDIPVIQCGNRCYINLAVLKAYLEKGGEAYDAKR